MKEAEQIEAKLRYALKALDRAVEGLEKHSAESYPKGIFKDLTPEEYGIIRLSLEICPVPHAMERMHAMWARFLREQESDIAKETLAQLAAELK